MARNPLDLAVNSRALGCGVSVGDYCLPLRFFSNDTVPDQADLAKQPDYISQQALEDVVLPMNLEMVAALGQHGVPSTYELHPGLHSDKYWDPFIRAQMEWHSAHLSHPLVPARLFTYRSIRPDFSVWGWEVGVTGRDAEEFLTLWSASEDGVTVTGSGTVTISTPSLGIQSVVSVEGARGGYSTSVADGRATITFTVAPAGPTDEHAGATGLPGGAGTVRIVFGH